MNLIINGVEAMKNVKGIRELLIQSRRAENEQVLVSASDAGRGFGFAYLSMRSDRAQLQSAADYFVTLRIA
jgi:hypothetical protein